MSFSEALSFVTGAWAAGWFIASVIEQVVVLAVIWAFILGAGLVLTLVWD